MHGTATFEWPRHELIQKGVFWGMGESGKPRNIGGNRKQSANIRNELLKWVFPLEAKDVAVANGK